MSSKHTVQIFKTITQKYSRLNCKAIILGKICQEMRAVQYQLGIMSVGFIPNFKLYKLYVTNSSYLKQH